MGLVAPVLIAFLLVYGLGYVVLSRTKRPLPESADVTGSNVEYQLIFLIPCLNEGIVVAKSLERLLELPYANKSIVVIDDGSDDDTYEIVSQYISTNVSILRREFPHARRGKGEALNYAFRIIAASTQVASQDPSKVIICIVDADGRLEPTAIERVLPYFEDPRVAAVQIGVRMYNATASILSRMQDFEFLVFTEIFQRARHQIGSSGLGGNGQFNRLSALQDLGDSPWSHRLTEDLDLGLTLIERGWINAFCNETYVAQQGVNSMSRLIRQRTRWFQGHMQCWYHIPKILKAQLSYPATIDILYNLVAPMSVLILSLAILVITSANLLTLIVFPAAYLRAVTADYGLPLITLYGFAFGFCPIYAYLYSRHTKDSGILRSFWYAHLYVLYSYIWFISGWKAVLRIMFKKKGWSKTARTPDRVLVSGSAAQRQREIEHVGARPRVLNFSAIDSLEVDAVSPSVNELNLDGSITGAYNYPASHVIAIRDLRSIATPGNKGN